MRRLIISIVVLIPFFLHAQQKQIDKGYDFFGLKDYPKALLYWEQVPETGRGFELLLDIAYSYKRMHHPEKAIYYYELAKKSNWPFSYEYMLDYGNSLREIERYEEAKGVFEKIVNVPLELIESCEWVLKENTGESILAETELIHKSENYSINGFFKDRDRLLIPLEDGDNYTFKWLNLSSGNMEPLANNVDWPYNLNSPNLIFDTLLFFSGNATKYKFIKEELIEKEIISEKGENKLFIWMLNLRDSKKQMTKLPFNNPNYSCTHPFVTNDGQRIYFVSDMPGGFGGFDIYYADKTIAGWTTPVNMGANINTEYDEAHPFEKDDVLFFSSKGHMGYGGYDIYMYDLKKQDEPVVNLRKPLNSSKDDFSYYENNINKGCFVSNRESKEGKDQLWYFTRLQQGIQTYKGNQSVYFNKDSITVCDKNGKAKFSLFTVADKLNQVSFRDSLIGLLLTDDNPRTANTILKLPLGNGTNDDSFYLSSKEPVQDSVFFDYYEDCCIATVIQNQRLAKIPFVFSSKKGDHVKTAFAITKNIQKITLPYVYFDLNSSNLIYSSIKEVEQLADFLQKHPGLTIELDGYTDQSGSNSYNQYLSEMRARVVHTFLTQKGVKTNRIKSTGKGVKKDSKSDSSARLTTFKFFVDR